MQWNVDRNGGFSKALPEKLYSPLIQNPVYSYQAVNVERQFQNPNSLLNWMRVLIKLRHKNPVFGRGTLEFLAPDNDRVLAFLRADESSTVLVVANLAHTSQAAQLDLSRFGGRTPVEMFGDAAFPPITAAPYQLALAPYGYYWFRLERA